MKRLLLALVVATLGLFAHAQPRWMVSDEAAALDTGALTQLRKANVEYIRLTVNIPRANPAPGVFVWDEVDRQINRMLPLGFKIYADFGWAPAHWSGGLPAYEEYIYGCSAWDNNTTVTFLIGDQPQPDNGQPLHPRWARKDTYVVPRGGTITIPAPGIMSNDGEYATGVVTKDTPKHGTMVLGNDGSLTYTHDGSDTTVDGFRYWVQGLDFNIHFAYDDYEYCRNVPHIDPEKVRTFTKEFINRYGHLIDYYGMWNEPGLNLYFPPEGPDKWDRYVNELIIPFTETVRDLDYTATLVGPECESDYCLYGVLSLEEKSGQQWFDILSFHPYPWNGDFDAVGGKEFWAEAVVHRIDNEFDPALQRFVKGRPIWATELGPDYNNPNYGEHAFKLATMISEPEYAWMRVFAFHSARTWFVMGTFENKTYQPNKLWFFTNENKPSTRRRAVGHKPIKNLQGKVTPYGD